jgi:hypothetical protein
MRSSEGFLVVAGLPLTQYCKTLDFVEEWIPRIQLPSRSAILGFEAELCQILRSTTLQWEKRIWKNKCRLVVNKFCGREEEN